MKGACAACLLLVACGPNVGRSEPVPASTTGASTSGSTNGTGSSTPGGTTSDRRTTTSSGDVEGTTTGSGTTGAGGRPDVGETCACDLQVQDCPSGFKCAPIATDADEVNAACCVPVDPRPDAPGDPCASRGPSGGVDSCEVGSVCWSSGEPTGEGFCVALCGDGDPPCSDPGTRCVIGADGFLPLCISDCDPLDPATCPGGQACVPFGGGFACSEVASPSAQPLEPCEFADACAFGSACLPAVEGACGPDASSCCLPFCDLTDPSCTAALACEPWFDDPPFYFEALGACR